MSLQNYTIDSTLTINSPRSKIALDRLGMDQSMIAKPLLSAFKISIANSQIAEEAYNMKLREVEDNLNELQSEFEQIEAAGITYEEFLLAGSPAELEALVNKSDADFSIQQRDFRIISNEDALMKRAQAEEAYREELKRQQEERIRRNKEIEEKHAKRLEELEEERKRKSIEEQERQAKIQQEKREFTMKLMERNEQLEREMRQRDETLKQQKLEQERQIELRMHQEQMQEEKLRLENARRKAEEERQKVAAFKEEQRRAERIEQGNMRRKQEEQREREQSMRMRQEETEKRQEEIKEKFQIQRREQERLWKMKMEEAQKNVEEQRMVKEADTIKKQEEFDQKIKEAKQLQVESDQKRQEELDQKLEVTYEKIEKVQKEREENDVDLLKRSVENELEFERKTASSEQLKRKREYNKKLQAIRTQNKLKVVDEMMAKRDEIRCKNVQLSVRLDSLKSLPPDERARREREILQSVGQPPSDKGQSTRKASAMSGSRSQIESPGKVKAAQKAQAAEPEQKSPEPKEPEQAPQPPPSPQAAQTPPQPAFLTQNENAEQSGGQSLRTVLTEELIAE